MNATRLRACATCAACDEHDRGGRLEFPCHRRAKQLTRAVADFLAANRSAGPYLLATAEGTAGTGAVSIVAVLEQFSAAGFVPRFWGLVGTPVSMIITLTGFVRWRSRASRCLTMCQFFEWRYGSRRLRIFAGALCWVSGVINMGIFPGVGTRFFMSFCALPDEVFGVLPVFPVLMAALLSTSVYLTTSGGQIAVIVTDFLQGMFCTRDSLPSYWRHTLWPHT